MKQTESLKINFINKSILLLLVLICILQSCKKTNSENKSIPLAITTAAISNITSISAIGAGKITSNDGSTITEKGLVWSTNPNPTIVLATKTSEGAGAVDFTSNITGLITNTTYYVRAYATNSSGTVYGNEVSFTTSIGLPVLGLLNFSNITATTATLVASLTNDGGGVIIAKGVVWSTTNNPTIALSTKTNEGTGTGNFTSTAINLTPGVTYYVRTYATNSAGTAYGPELSFTTPVIVIAAGGLSGGAFIIRDGVETRLENSSGAVDVSAVKSIFLSGSDEYLAGYTGSPSYRYAKIWKNGVQTIIQSNYSQSQANSIYVNGTDVYVAGVGVANGRSGAIIWKNGISTNLTPSSDGGGANAVYVSNNNVYVAGHEVLSSGAVVAKFWKNGVGTNLVTPSLTNPSTLDSKASSIIVSGSDVYVGGYQYYEDKSGSRRDAKIWKNGVPISLTNGPGDAFVNAVLVSGTDVYAVGITKRCITSTGNGVSVATYWKNGIPTYLSDCTKQEGFANTIYIKGGVVYVGGNVINFKENGTSDNSNGYSRYTIWHHRINEPVIIYKQSLLGSTPTRIEAIIVK
jgi:hypothetical protein